jgi:CubicO group peptidase (beta-lactamase class C family)
MRLLFDSVMVYFLALLVAAACLNSLAHAQVHSPPAASPSFSTVAPDLIPGPPVPPQPSWLDVAKLRLEAMRKEWQVPGVGVAIVHRDHVLMASGMGVKEVGQEGTVDGQTLFAIASNTKAFTTMAIAKLVERGKLSWDDLVRTHLPDFTLHDRWISSELTVRDLVTHRSGLGTFSGDLLWWASDYSRKELTSKLRHLPAEGPFRSHYGYSNVLYIVAGQVIESVSGESWESFVRKEILGPLGMHRTLVSVRDLVSAGNYAQPHKTLATSSQPIPWMNWDNMAPAGSLISSPEDMAKWVAALLRNASQPEGPLVKQRTLHDLWAPQTIVPISDASASRFPSTHFRAYGSGWALSDYQGRKLIAHGGGYDGMYSQVMLVPEEQLGVVVLTNSMTGYPSAATYELIDLALGLPSRDWSGENLELFRKSRQAFRERIDKAIQPVATNTKPSHPMTDYQGVFECPMYGQVKVDSAGDQLKIAFLRTPGLAGTLQHLHYDTFVIHWDQQYAWFDEGTVHFVCNSSGVFERIELNVPNDDLWFHELSLKRRKELDLSGK